MAAKVSNESLMWWTVGGLILFWLIAIPALAMSNPFGELPRKDFRS